MNNRELRIKITFTEAKIELLKRELESLEKERDFREDFYDSQIEKLKDHRTAMYGNKARVKDA